MESSDRPDPMAMHRLHEQLANQNIKAAYRPNRARYPYEAQWPADVWSIGLDRLDLLGVSETGGLHWDGQPVEIKRPLTLSWWQRLGAVVVVISAVIGAVAAVVSAYAAYRSIPAQLASAPQPGKD